jgi:hypothetical protein
MDRETEKWLIEVVIELDETMRYTQQAMFAARNDPTVKDAILNLQQQIWRARKMVATKWREI